MKKEFYNIKTWAVMIYREDGDKWWVDVEEITASENVVWIVNKYKPVTMSIFRTKKDAEEFARAVSEDFSRQGRHL